MAEQGGGDVEPECTAPGSQAVAVLRAMPPRTRSQLRIPDNVAAIWDAVVRIAHAIEDEESDEPTLERISGALATISAEFDDEEIPAFLEELARQFATVTSAKQFPDWLRQLGREGFNAYAERLLGAGAYRRLRLALSDDVTAVCDALRRLTIFCMPYVLALEDVMLQTIDPAKAAGSPLDPTRTMLGLVTRVDRALDRIADAAGNKDLTPEILTDFRAPTADQMAATVDYVRTSLRAKTSAAAEQLGDQINRKFRGARQALTTSADPASQAAHSTVELIDRLLRTAFTHDEVLAWLADHFAGFDGDPRLTYRDHKGGLRPTVRAKCLCFLYAGQPPGEDTALYDVLAETVVTVRGALQNLKHADEGTIEELDEVVQLIYAVEAVILVSQAIVWRGLPDSVTQKMRDRLGEPIKPVESAALGQSA